MKDAQNDLQRIPGVGPRIAALLNSIGIKKAADLRGKDPEALYQKLSRRQGGQYPRKSQGRASEVVELEG